MAEQGFQQCLLSLKAGDQVPLDGAEGAPINFTLNQATEPDDVLTTRHGTRNNQREE
jgi:hypothetical protein